MQKSPLKIKALCAEYGLNYNEASFMKQFSTVWVRLAECSLPNEWTAQVKDKVSTAKSFVQGLKAKFL